MSRNAEASQPFGASASVTRLACGQGRPRGETWPSLSSLCSVQAQRAVVTLLILVPASRYYLVYLPCSHSLPSLHSEGVRETSGPVSGDGGFLGLNFQPLLWATVRCHPISTDTVSLEVRV